MALLIPSLIAGGVLAGNTGGATAQPGIQGNGVALANADGQGFLAAVTALGTNGTVPSILQQAGNAQVGNTDAIAEQIALLFAQLSQITSGQSVTGQLSLALPAENASMPEKTISGQGATPGIIEGSPSLALVAGVSNTDETLAQTSIPVGTQPVPLDTVVVVDIVSLEGQGAVNTAPAIPTAADAAQYNQTGQVIANVLSVTSAGGEEIVLPASFIAIPTDETSAVNVQEVLKIPDIASQNVSNDVNGIDISQVNILLDGVVTAPKIDTNKDYKAETQSQPTIQNTLAILQGFAGEVTGVGNTGVTPVAQSGIVLANRAYKKADSSLQQGVQVLAQVVRGDALTSNNNAIFVRFGKPTNGVNFSSFADINDSKTTPLPGQPASTQTLNGAGIADISATAIKPLGSEAVSSDKPLSQHGSVIDQVTVHINQAAKENLKKITVHLEPASLGKVDIKIDFSHEGKTHVSILADRPETLELLQKDAKQLQTALNDAGVKADAGSLNFSMRGGEQQQQGRFANPQGFSSYNTNPLVKEIPALPDVSAYIGRSLATQGVDISV